MYFLYSALLAVALVGAGPYWLYQALRYGKYRKGFSERLGRVPERLRNAGRPSIWVHAVSVGEVLAVEELVMAMRREFPGHRVVISTTTDTGQRLAASRFGPENVFYFPFDFALSVRPWLAALRPKLIVIAETEFWPNFLRLAKHAGAYIMVVNARISDRSFPGYRRWRNLLCRVLREVDLFLAQTNEDARRLVDIGALEPKVFVSGNLKFDVAPPMEPPFVGRLRTALRESGAGPILVCGSTVAGEEEILLTSFKHALASYPQSVMLLAPRHPERFADVQELLKLSGVTSWRRSQWSGEPLSGGALLIDSIGELASLYSLADLAFVGGSLVPRGGHNILEPAQYGVPILVGEHTENFRDIVELFIAQGAVRVVTPTTITAVLLQLLASPVERQALGRRSTQTLRTQQGATEFTLSKVRELMAAREVTTA